MWSVVGVDLYLKKPENNKKEQICQDVDMTLVFLCWPAWAFVLHDHRRLDGEWLGATGGNRDFIAPLHPRQMKE